MLSEKVTAYFILGETVSAQLLLVFSNGDCRLGGISSVLLGPSFSCSTLSGLVLLGNLRRSDGFFRAFSILRFLPVNS